LKPLALLLLSTATLLGTGCVTARPVPPTPVQVTAPEPRPPPQEIHFPPVYITGDPELEKLNDAELFAAGTAAYAADDFKGAARYFGRIADFHPESTFRRQALYNSGLALEKLSEWGEALGRFAELSDAEKGTGDALDAAYRHAEVLYHLERYADAAKLLATLSARTDLTLNKRLEAQVQQGVCELEAGQTDVAEATLRKAMALYQGLRDKDEVDDYFPAQGQFFLGEIFRMHYESVKLDPERSADQLSKDLEFKAELLLSAQGHYLRAMRVGNGYWATAAGERVGGLYEGLYDHMVNAPAPRELTPEEAGVYLSELRKKLRVLITKSINVYERTLEAAERIGARSHFVDKTRESLRKMKDVLLTQTQEDEAEAAAAAAAAEAARARSQGKPGPEKKAPPRGGKKTPRTERPTSPPART
jgi:tetratricopeptide (TPR) repeat protein